MKPPPRRPLVVRYAVPIIFVPAVLAGWLVAQFTGYGNIPLAVTVIICAACARFTVRVWENHCARYGHRADL